MSISLIGRVLRDRYRVESVVGSGHMADVYRGYDLVLDRMIAIKLLTGGDEATRARFVEEARSMAVLNHPNMLAVFDIGEVDALSYIIMEYVDGSSLAELSQTRLSFSRLKSIFLQILSALELAHRRNIVHRDLKPANVLVDGTGLVKVADFGLSRRMSDLTTGGRPGEVIGTVSYLPPEVFLGKPSDGRGDLYSLGVMMYEMFTGRLPFRSESGDIVAVVYAHVHETATPPRAIERALPLGLERLILKLLEKEPERRYPNAATVVLELESFRFTADTGRRAVDDLDLPSQPIDMEPAIRTILDRMLSPQRSTKVAFGKILTAMLAIRRQEFAKATALYNEALVELRSLKSESEYLKGALGMGDCLVLWLRHACEEVDLLGYEAALLHLEEAKTLARQCGQAREFQAIERILGEMALLK